MSSFTSRRIREDGPRRTSVWPRILLTILRFGRPLLSLFLSWKKSKDAKDRRARRILVLKRIALVLISIFLVLLLFASVARGLTLLRVISFSGILDPAGAELPKDNDGFTNILLLGQGDSSHDGKDLTDTIMVASMDGKTQSVVLLSLPRDLYFLHTEKMGKGRINSMIRDYKGFLKSQRGMEESAASLEAMQELAKEIGNAINLDIHHVIKVDFVGFVQAVDAVGGVDLDVPYAIIDTEYPGPDYTFETFEISAGVQHLDGETALKYARSRHTTSDFDRSARQQQILAFLAEKVKREGLVKSPSRIMSLFNIVNKHLETTLSLRAIVSLAKRGSTIDARRILAMQLNDRNGLYGSLVEPGGFLYSPPRDLFEGAAVLLPVSIPEYPVTWKQIQTMTDLLFRTRSLYLTKPRIHVLNAGAKSGLARELGGELHRYGFDVPAIENAEVPKREDTMIIPRAKADEPVAEFLSALLKIPIGDAPPDILPHKAGPITIIVGKNYVFTPLQDLMP